MFERWVPVAVAMSATMSCASDAHRPDAKVSTQPSSLCASNPNVPWLAAQDRACDTDASCTLFVSDQCNMLSISARAVASGRYASMGCPVSGAVAPTHMCICAVPGLETRCHQGCCQKRFSGTPGPWLP